jgi:hypothetical protein
MRAFLIMKQVPSPLTYNWPSVLRSEQDKLQCFSLLLVVLGAYMLLSAVAAAASPPCIKNPKRALDCILLARSCPHVECACFQPIFHAFYRYIEWWLDGMRVCTSLYAN